MEFFFGKNYEERGETHVVAWNFTDKNGSQYLTPPPQIQKDQMFNVLTVFVTKHEHSIPKERCIVLHKDIDDYGDLIYISKGPCIRELEPNIDAFRAVYGNNLPETLYAKETFHTLPIPAPPVPPEEQDISILDGKTIKNVSVFRGTDGKPYTLIFQTSEDKYYEMTHDQDCCEQVYLDDVAGGAISDIIGEEIVSAYSTQRNSPNPNDYSSTWTFYTINTIKHSITLRWYGESNGYYSEDVDFRPTTQKWLNRLTEHHHEQIQNNQDPAPYNH